jgi:tetratricopeptide (TPR) repeat protein
MRRNLVSLVVAALLIGSFGCESNSSTARLNLATREFASHRYEAAYRLAREAAQGTTTPARFDAHYVAGLCAYEMGDLDEADYRLSEAANAPTPETRAKATAMLGVVRMKQNRTQESVRLLRAAAENLDSKNSEKALMFASIATETPAGASVQYAALDATATHRSSAIASAPRGNAFVLQVGAFLERPRAENAASAVRTLAQDRGVGPVRVVTQKDDRGRRLYMVQLGDFATRQQAMRARTDLGQLQYIVTHVDAGSGGVGTALAYP